MFQAVGESGRKYILDISLRDCISDVRFVIHGEVIHQERGNGNALGNKPVVSIIMFEMICGTMSLNQTQCSSLVNNNDPGVWVTDNFIWPRE